MEGYATKEDTIKFLKELGFIEIDSSTYNSPNSDSYGMHVAQVYIYKCVNGYYCVDVEGGYKAPVVWSGPRADWDTSDPGQDFVNYLNKYFPTWR